jgi:predicted  nucleic acid-binding Zn-ribbon protein
MNIAWSEDPLATAIELDELEKQVLGLKLRVEDLEERVFMASHRLKSEGAAEDKIASALAELE